ncbi:multiple epidermal growth factor domains protein 11, partial [Biomphalaria glabrata]
VWDQRISLCCTRPSEEEQFEGMKRLTILLRHNAIHSFLTLLLLVCCCTKLNGANRTVCNLIYFKSRVTDYSWYAASEYCESMGGELASIDTEQVHEIFVRYQDFNPSTSLDSEFIWLGAFGLLDDMKWTNGKLVVDGYQNWVADNSPEDKMCVSIDARVGLWQSSDCNGAAGVAYCEKCVVKDCTHVHCSFICICRNAVSCVNVSSSCSEGCVLAALSNITKLDCSSHRYGQSCESQCFCDQEAPCDSTLGRCPGNCLKGWHGSNCDETSCPHKKWGPNCELNCFCRNSLQCNEATGECSDGCIDGVSGVSCNKSLMCAANSWGEECSKACHCGGNGHCNSKTGQCLDETAECNHEFQGLSCSESGKNACPMNTWGSACQYSCFCKDVLPCYRSNGNCTNGCQDGVKGLACNETISNCPLNRYGLECQFACHCAESRQCHPETGFCLTKNQTCDEGWQGERCSNTACQLYYFGPGCQYVCNCANNNQCPIDIGICPDGKCISGWTGISCNESECGEGLYGKDCEEICECPPDEFCNKLTGKCVVTVATTDKQKLMQSSGWTTRLSLNIIVVLIWLIVYQLTKLLLFLM